MNERELRLGKYESQFFAWVQLRRKTQVATGEAADALGLTDKQERELLSRMARQGLIVRLRRGLYMVPPRLPPGGKWTPGEYVIVDSLMADADANYQIGGPNAFQQHGFDEQVPNSITVYNDKISGTRTIGGLSFNFIKVRKERLGGIDTLKLPTGEKLKMANVPRTIMDAVYDWSRFNTIPRAFNWISERKKDAEMLSELVNLTLKYSNVGTMRRIGYILEKNGLPNSVTQKLKFKVDGGTSLIPLVPTKPARGTIDREWGIIDNL